MCAALAGEPGRGAALLTQARRRRVESGIDLLLAQKVVGAAGGRQAITIEWDGVDRLSAWRWGLASTTGVAPGAPVAAAFAPTAVSVFVDAPHGSPRTVIAARVTELEPYADEVRVTTTTPGGDVLTATVTAAAVGDLDLYPGRDVVLAVKATAVAVYPV